MLHVVLLSLSTLTTLRACSVEDKYVIKLLVQSEYNAALLVYQYFFYLRRLTADDLACSDCG